MRSEVAEIPALKQSIRHEKQEHAESKSSYSDTLKAALRLMLCANKTGFDHRCRVTIYRRQTDADNEFRQIFRYSENHSYQVGGRYKIPLNEGVVGAAWHNHGTKHVSIDPIVGGDAFNKAMLDMIEPEGCKVPTCDLSMPSTEFYAKALDDHENGHRVGIVVYECIEQDVFSVEDIDNILTEQSLELARFVKHLGRLDLEFAPSARGE